MIIVECDAKPTHALVTLCGDPTSKLLLEQATMGTLEVRVSNFEFYCETTNQLTQISLAVKSDGLLCNSVNEIEPLTQVSNRRVLVLTEIKRIRDDVYDGLNLSTCFGHLVLNRIRFDCCGDIDFCFAGRGHYSEKKGHASRSEA